MTTPVSRPAIVRHVFLHESIEQDELTAFWNEAAEGLKPVDTWSASPDLKNSGTGRLLALRRKKLGLGFRDVAAYRLHDMIGVSLTHAPNIDAEAWTDLESSSLPDLPARHIIGEATVYAGHWADGSDASDLHPHVPESGQDESWTTRLSLTADGISWWELPGERTSHRRLLVMSALEDESALDRFLSAGTARELPWLTRYLAQAARLREQRRLLNAGLPRLRQAAVDTDTAAVTLAGMLSNPHPTSEQLEQADAALTTARVQQGGLITSAGDVRAMAATVRGVTRNLELMTAGSAMDAAGGPVDADRAVADLLTHQLLVESDYLESARLKADELSRIAGEVLGVTRHRRQEFLTLLQTAILGGLLMALTAVQSLGYRVPVPEWLIPPIIVMVTAVAVLLPVALASRRWLKRRHRRARRSR